MPDAKTRAENANTIRHAAALEAKAREIATLCRVCFDAEDDYASAATMRAVLADDKAKLWTIKEAGRYVAFLLAREHPTWLEGLRIGVRPGFRGRRYAKRLMAMAFATAASKHKPYRTYCLSSNVPSLNLHVGLRMRFYDTVPSAIPGDPRMWLERVFP